MRLIILSCFVALFSLTLTGPASAQPKRIVIDFASPKSVDPAGTQGGAILELRNVPAGENPRVIVGGDSGVVVVSSADIASLLNGSKSGTVSFLPSGDIGNLPGAGRIKLPIVKITVVAGGREIILNNAARAGARETPPPSGATIPVTRLDSSRNIIQAALALSKAATRDEAKAILRGFLGREELHNPYLIATVANLPRLRLPLRAEAYLQQSERRELTLQSGLDLSGGLLAPTAVADAIGRFAAKRFQEEIGLYGVETVKRIFIRHPEIQALFPRTWTILTNVESYQYSTFVTTLRENFAADFEYMIENLKILLRDKEPMLQDRDAYYVFMSALDILQAMRDGADLYSVTQMLDVNESIAKLENSSVKGAFSTLALVARNFNDGYVSESFNSSARRIKWIHWISLNEALSIDGVPQLVLALLDEKEYRRTSQISFGGQSLSEIIRKMLGTMPTSPAPNAQQVTALCDFVRNLVMLADRAEKVLKERPPEDAPQLVYDRYRRMFDIGVQMYAMGIEGLRIGDPSIDVNTEISTRWLPIGRNALEIYINILEKDYAGIVSNLSVILNRTLGSREGWTVSASLLTDKKEEIDNLDPGLYTALSSVQSPSEQGLKKKLTLLMPDSIPQQQSLRTSLVSGGLLKRWDKVANSKAMKEIVRVGTFGVNFVRAKNSEEMADVLEAFALPAGSFRIKRQSVIDVSINLYAGGSYSLENIRGETGRNAMYGFTTPVGVAISTDFGREGFPCVTLFLSAIDVGAVTMYRLYDKDRGLPELTWKNILAPGIHLYGGIPSTPLVLGAGVQFGPQLRKIDTGGAFVEPQSFNRICFTLAVDIPVMTLFSKPH